MKEPSHLNHVLHCQVCGQERTSAELIPAELVRDSVVETILLDHPDWSPAGYICTADLKTYHMRHLRAGLEQQKGTLSDNDRAVLETLGERRIVSRDIVSEFEKQTTFGQRIADRIAAFGGSWTFIISFLCVLAVWIAGNSLMLLYRPFDPFPFILLNLVLSCVAAMQAPVIMMSQNRQEARDRLHAEHDYRVNLKAEVEIQQLHEKLDHYLMHQWERLLEIQRTQISMMEKLLADADEKKA
jgi:uncharacterized membrane protein